MNTTTVKLVRISKREAKQRFANDQSVLLCPCKLSPSSPWNVAYNCCCGKEWIERCEGDVDRAWDTMYRNWTHFNANCYETGYYAHYYKEV